MTKKKYMIRSTRKIVWYNKNKKKIAEKKHNKRNEARIAAGKPTIEEEYEIKNRNLELRIKVIKTLRARKEGKPDPYPITFELEEGIKIAEEKRMRNVMKAREWRKQQREYELECKKFQERIASIREKNDEEKSIPISSCTPIDLFDDEDW